MKCPSCGTEGATMLFTSIACDACDRARAFDDEPTQEYVAPKRIRAKRMTRKLKRAPAFLSIDGVNFKPFDPDVEVLYIQELPPPHPRGGHE